MILLDTNVVSELMKDRSDPAVESWYLANEGQTVFSSVALAELAYGVARLTEGARKRDLLARLTELRLKYAERTHVFGASAAMHYGSIMAEAEALGHTMSFPDAQIAAIAVEHGFGVATRNTKDFQRTGLKLVNPWMA